MNFATLALALAFLALGLSFRASAGKASDPVKVKNARFAANLMLLAGGGFLAAFAVSAVNEQ